jgi:hypothetical protein
MNEEDVSDDQIACPGKDDDHKQEDRLKILRDPSDDEASGNKSGHTAGKKKEVLYLFGFPNIDTVINEGPGLQNDQFIEDVVYDEINGGGKKPPVDPGPQDGHDEEHQRDRHEGQEFLLHAAFETDPGRQDLVEEIIENKAETGEPVQEEIGLVIVDVSKGGAGLDGG